MSLSPSEGSSADYRGSDVHMPPPTHYPTVPLDPTSTPPPAMPANWYPDPSAAGLLRYWDGARWTEHRQAVTPAATATVVNNVSVRGGSGSEVALHLILTILTCGLWLPVWILIEIIKAVSR